MALAFGLLAVYQEEQDLMYQELKDVLSDKQVPVRTKQSAFSEEC